MNIELDQTGWGTMPSRFQGWTRIFLGLRLLARLLVCCLCMLNSCNIDVANPTISSRFVFCWKTSWLRALRICQHIIATTDRKFDSNLRWLFTKEVQTSKHDVAFFYTHSMLKPKSFQTLRAMGHSNKVRKSVSKSWWHPWHAVCFGERSTCQCRSSTRVSIVLLHHLQIQFLTQGGTFRFHEAFHEKPVLSLRGCQYNLPFHTSQVIHNYLICRWYSEKTEVSIIPYGNVHVRVPAEGDESNGLHLVWLEKYCSTGMFHLLDIGEMRSTTLRFSAKYWLYRRGLNVLGIRIQWSSHTWMESIVPTH